MQINNPLDLGKELGIGGSNEDKVKPVIIKSIFRYTSCGASITFQDKGITVGSIIEGVDGDGTEYHKLEYPFTGEKFWETVKSVETEAKAIWNDTHGCDDCGHGEGELGYPQVNPECKSCHGLGVSI